VSPRVHIYVRSGILTHALSTLPTIAVRFSHYCGRKSDRRLRARGNCVGSTTGPAQIVRFWMPLGLGLNLVTNRVGVYLALMDDRYPSTDDHQSSILTTSIPMPNVISTGGFRW
jgi:hypothetical protein